MGKEHNKNIRAPRRVWQKCPKCTKVHMITEWHNQSLSRWKTILKLPSNRANCFYECPSCREASRGSDLTPVIKDGQGNLVGEGWFSYYHTTE